MTIYRVDFQNMLDAQRALEKLKEQGYKKSYLDMVEKYSEEYSEEIVIDSPLSVPNLSSAALRSGSCKAVLGKSPLAASNPSVSGVGSLCELSGNRATSLFVNIQENQTEEVKAILSEYVNKSF
jgi:hypothetical protein